MSSTDAFKVYQGHKAAGYNTAGSPYYSASFDNSGNLTCAVVLNCGTAATNGVVAIELQESADNATWTDVSGNDTLIAARQSDGTHEAIYYGSQVNNTARYLRLRATISNATVEFSTSVIAVPRRTEQRTAASFTR